MRNACTHRLVALRSSAHRDVPGARHPSCSALPSSAEAVPACPLQSLRRRQAVPVRHCVHITGMPSPRFRVMCQHAFSPLVISRAISADIGLRASLYRTCACLFVPSRELDCKLERELKRELKLSELLLRAALGGLGLFPAKLLMPPVLLLSCTTSARSTAGGVLTWHVPPSPTGCTTEGHTFSQGQSRNTNLRVLLHRATTQST